MKLTYFRTDPSNFGDELNAWMWQRLLPEGFLDDDPSELFLGVGSIIGEVYNPASRKIVMGSGYGGYIAPPALKTGNWEIVFVRGPRTANVLGLPPAAAICDSAILLRVIDDLPGPAPDIGTAFMPHYQSLQRGNWPDVCARAGVTMIDPTGSPDQIIAQISGAKLLITEAMHGAIVADALRTPWIPLWPIHRSHRMKWQDWAESLQLELDWATPWPSTILELVTLLTGRSGLSKRTQKLLGPSIMRLPNLFFTYLAARRIMKISTHAGSLSDENVIKAVTRDAYAALNAFVVSRGARSSSTVLE